jgi:nucleoside-diphosphate-sugar epimerase
MKTVILGGNSLVGQALKPALSAFSEVITAGRKNCDLIIDLNDPIDNINIPLNTDTVILAAASFGGNTDEEMVEAINTNVVGTLKICQAAVLANAKHLILISSIFASMNPDSKYYNIYALTKKQSEEVAKFYCSNHSLKLTVIRPSQIYGSEGFRRHQPFFYSIIDKAELGEEITLFGTNDALRNFIHIDDVVAVLSKVVEHQVEGYFNCSQTTNVSYSQIAHAAFKVFNSKASVHFLKDKPDTPDNIFKQDNSLYKAINFYPQISIEEGLQRIADYRKNNQ